MAPVEMLKLPFNCMLLVLMQTVLSDPALATGAGVIYTVVVVDAGLQPPLFVLLSVNVTIPAVMSAPPGRYIPFTMLGEKEPVPLVVQVPDPVVDVPVSATEALFAQTV